MSSTAPLTNEQCEVFARGPNDACATSTICAKCLTINGCGISSRGACVSQEYNSRDDDYSVAIARGLVLPAARASYPSAVNDRQAWVFNAGSASYCDRDDSVCTECVANKFWAPSWLVGVDSRFCTGRDGCVCIYNCEFSSNASCPTPAPATTSSLIDADSANTTATPSPTDSSSSSYDPNFWSPIYAPATPSPTKVSTSTIVSSVSIYQILPFVAFGVIVLWVIHRVWRQKQRQRERDDRQPQTVLQLTQDGLGADQVDHSTDFIPLDTASRSLGEPTLRPQLTLPSVSLPRSETVSRTTRPEQQPLELYGWISHRQHLIDTENRRLNGADDFVPPRASYYVQPR